MQTTDFAYISTWWLYLLTIGVAFYPMAYLVFRKNALLSYGFSKTLGILIISYTAFVPAIFKLTTLSALSVRLTFTALVIVNLVLFIAKRKDLVNTIKKTHKLIIFQEFLFTAGLVGWSFIRSHNPDIRGLEKFMDFGFINSILQSKTLPPADMWFAGKSINYYWFGHYVTAILTKISQIPSYISYNLMIATILGLSLMAAFSLSSFITKSVKLSSKKIFAAGIISAILLVFAGNFHTPIYSIRKGFDDYWYPDATRFIGYNPDTNDKTIHEFPLYSFVVADLHAHLINLPFVLIFIAILANRLIDKSKNNSFEIVQLLPLGFVLGIMFMTNTWDFGNYLLLSGIAFSLFIFLNNGVNIDSFFMVIVKSVAILIISLIIASPFIINFGSIAKGVQFVDSTSPLWQLAILWGLPIILSAALTAAFYFTRSKLVSSDLFVASLMITSIVLIILPEIVYVKDIYVKSHYRANTMFKLTYQAFVMSYLSAGYVFVRILNLIKKRIPRILLFMSFVLVSFSLLMFPYFAVKSAYNKLKNYQGLDGRVWVKDIYPGEYDAIVWLQNNTSGQPTILEAPGNSYTDYNLISAYTGYPTVSGWFVHEWLWRGDASYPQERVQDIDVIYTTDNEKLAASLLDKYSVKYVLVGTFEKEKYPNLNEEKFDKIATEVFSSGAVSIYKLSSNHNSQ